MIIQPELIQNYLKFEIENKSNNINQNYIIVFSNKDENCLEREQLSLGIFKTQMWLIKKQIENNNNYFLIECNSYDCSYKLTIISYNIIQMDFNTDLTLYLLKIIEILKLILNQIMPQ